MGQTLQARADQLAEACSLGYLQLATRYDEVSKLLEVAQRERDRYHVVALRLDRAVVEMQLRDVWGPWSRQGGRWNAWMWDDIRAARRVADEVAAETGDSGLVPRLLIERPRLGAVLDMPA